MEKVAAWALLLVLLGLAALLPDCTAQGTAAAELCPGVSGGVCGKGCQLHTCEALGRFYRATLNESNPWDDEHGWELTSTMSCEQLVERATVRRAVYCSWFGITCCTPEAVAAGNCSTVNSVYGVRLVINNLNASVGDVRMVQPMQQLHDCGMRSLNLEANNLAGQFHPAWGGLKHLLDFNFGNCWITGSIPSSMRSMRNLTQINLSNNWLNGTLPVWLDELQQLRILNLGSQFGANQGTDASGLMGTVPRQLSKLQQLRELNLEANVLTGELPEALCNEDSKLLVLNLRGNQLTGGAAAVESCGGLVTLDVSHNQFTGPLPASERWEALISYRVGNNLLSGTFPPQLATSARILEHLDISNNLLTGRLPNQITLLSGLKTLLMSNNSFTGTLTEDVFYLPALLTLDVSNNSFVGTIHEAIGLAYSLQSIDYSNNPGMTGRIPPEMGLLQGLQSAQLQNTSFSCSGITQPYTAATNASCSDPARCKTPRKFGDVEAQQHVCSIGQQLPCFLRFSDYLLPREDASNMRCKYIVRLPREQALQACSGDPGVDPTDLGNDAQLLPNMSPKAHQQLWFVDPSYFQYQQCECLLGYQAGWDQHRTILTCVPEPRSSPAFQRTAVIVSSVASALVLCLLLLVWRQYRTMQPRWLRERVMQAKRTKGPPSCTKAGDKVTVSVVVTDVKDFSELTRKCPELMSKAMGGHNNILRKACHTHAGYVMDQEGDSWSVAFHSAEDAVAFSLQVQQALAQKVWGMRRGASEAALADLRSMTAMRDDGFSSRFSVGALSATGSAAAAAPAAAAAAGTAAPQLRSNSHESSLSGMLQERVAASVAAASMQQQALQQGAVGDAAGSDACSIPRAGPSFTGGASFTSSRWRGVVDGSSSSHGDLGQLTGPIHSMDAAADGRMLSAMWLSKYRRMSNGSHSSQPCSYAEAVRDLSSLQHAHACLHGQDLGFATQAAVQQQQQQQDGHLCRPSPSFASSVHWTGLDCTSASMLHKSGDSSSKVWVNGAAAFMRRFAQLGRNGSGQMQPMQLASEQVPMQVLRLAVRIGIATGTLPYGVDVANCTVKDRAKDLVCDVANAGQVLMDEATFLLIKDSLSVLGTVSEGGYDDQMLQALMHSQAIGKLQQQVACGACARRQHSSQSFSSDVLTRGHRDYDNDAIVVHMGCFAVPALTDDSITGAGEADTSTAVLPPSAASQTELIVPRSAAAASRSNKDSGQQPQATQQLHLYSVAAPGMRQRQGSTEQLPQLLSWSDAVNVQPGWVQLQKGFWEAPGAHAMDLSPSTGVYQASRAPLPDVTVVFVSVAGAAGFTFKRSCSDTRFVNKVIRRCMLQQLAVLPGRDGYLCRCQESELKYMVAFERPHRAVQWCLAVQEALMYASWPASVVSHPGFEQVLDPDSGLPLFRGPRLRMGLSEGQPFSVTPDHNGRANYWGSCVNRAARYMDAAAHGGQVVTDVDLLRKVMAVWACQGKDDSADNTADSNVQELPPAIDASPWQHTLQGEQQRQPSAQPSGQPSAQPQVQPSARSQGKPAAQLQGQQQQLQQQVAAAPASLPCSQVGQLPAGSAAKRWSQLKPAVAAGDGDPHGLLVPVQRSRSENYTSHQVTFSLPPLPQRFSNLQPHLQQQQQQQQRLGVPLRGGTRSSSFTYGAGPRLSAVLGSSSGAAAAAAAAALQASPFQAVMLSQGSLLSTGRAAAGLTDLPEAGLTITSPDGVAAAHCEPVHALRLGTFVFKGSGEHQMAHVLHGVLAKRSFPAEPPKGKGQRLVTHTGPVDGLQGAVVQLPQCLLAARAAFLLGE